MELLPTKSISWAAAATDAPKLRSFLMFPHKYPAVNLMAHPSGMYAVSSELLQQGRNDEHYTRVTVYGNTRHPQPLDYEHAAQQILLFAAPSSACLKFSAIPEAAVAAVTRVVESHGWGRSYCEPCLQYIYVNPLSRDTTQQGKQQLPVGYQLDVLQQGDAPLVDSMWTFRSDTSLALIQGLIGTSHTSCIRTPNGSPVAWILEVEPLCGGMLHVLEQHRGRGLARIVCQDLFAKLELLRQHHNQQEQEGGQLPFHSDTMAVGAANGPSGNATGDAVYCYIVESNTGSLSLMESLGLQRTGVFSWLGFEKLQ